MLYHVTRFYAPEPDAAFAFLRREIDRKDVVRDVGRRFGAPRSTWNRCGWLMVIVLDSKAAADKLRAWLATQVATQLGYYWGVPSSLETILDGTDRRGPAEGRMVSGDGRKVCDRELEEVAMSLLRAAGAEAAARQAAARIEAWQERGDSDRAATWRRVADAIDRLCDPSKAATAGAALRTEEAQFYAGLRRRLGRGRPPLARSGPSSCPIDEGLARLIDDYKAAVAAAVDLMAKSGIERPDTALEWMERPMEQYGFFEGGVAYFAHDRGCEVGLPSGVVDFDFGPDGEVDGFDCRRLAQFAEGRLEDYRFSALHGLTAAFRDALASGAIVEIEREE
jgi:hypothetical protein